MEFTFVLNTAYWRNYCSRTTSPRFGELINRRDQRLSALLNHEIHDRDLVPPLGDLPESISAVAFQRHFGSTSSPAYRQLTAEIERRLDGMPLYQPAQR